MSSVLCHLAPPSIPHSGSREQLIVKARENWPGFKIYCSRVWTHEPSVSTGLGQKQLPLRSSLAPDTNIGNTIVLVKNTNWLEY